MYKYLISSLRISHWIKNSFIFAALIFSRHFLVLNDVLKACLAFLLFSFISSAGYLINDLVDLEEDKKHPIKKDRAIASGKISQSTAVWMAVVLVVIALGFGFVLGYKFVLILVSYLILELVYSFFLKHRVILDVFGLAGAFILRVIAGGVAISVSISSWLLICTGLISLFLGFSKRRHELVLLGDGASKHRKVLTEYSPYFLDQMISVVTASTLIAYILYTLSPETIAKFHTDKLIFTTPFVLYGIFRYLYLVHQKEKGGNPTKILLTDTPLIITIALWALTAILIIYQY